jgi:hypothetical protein
VGDGDDRAGVLGEVLLQPLHALRVQVVGGLVEQQQVGRLEQQLAQRDPAALTTGELGDVGVRRRAAQRVHRQLELESTSHALAWSSSSWSLPISSISSSV